MRRRVLGLVLAASLTPTFACGSMRTVAITSNAPITTVTETTKGAAHGSAEVVHTWSGAVAAVDLYDGVDHDLVVSAEGFDSEKARLTSHASGLGITCFSLSMLLLPLEITAAIITRQFRILTWGTLASCYRLEPAGMAVQLVPKPRSAEPKGEVRAPDAQASAASPPTPESAPEIATPKPPSENATPSPRETAPELATPKPVPEPTPPKLSPEIATPSPAPAPEPTTTPARRFCTSCGAQFEESGRFCTSCGTPR